MPRFSIIIPVRGVTNYLKESVQKIKELDFKDFEVVVVTDEEVCDLMDSRFVAISSGPVGPAEKRNLGARIAKGEIIAFLDDDAYPQKDWLTVADKIFKDSQVFALGGPALTPKNASFLEKMSGKVLESFVASGFTVFRHKPSAKRIIFDYPSVNLFVRKEAFLSVGGFVTRFWPGEDTKLCLDLVKKYGRGFLYDPSVIVYHHRRNLLIPHLKQISRYGRHRGQFAKVYPETSRAFQYFIPSMIIFGLVVGPALCVLLPFLWSIYFSFITLYLSVILFEFARNVFKEKSLLSGYYVAVGIFLTHIVYGINFIIGYIKKPELELRKLDNTTGNYIEG